MALCSVRAKHGSLTRSYDIEFKSRQAVFDFFARVSVMDIVKVVGFTPAFESNTYTKIDDGNYKALAYVTIKNKALGYREDFVIHKIKSNRTTAEIGQAVKDYIEIGGVTPTSVTVILYTR